MVHGKRSFTDDVCDDFYKHYLSYPLWCKPIEASGRGLLLANMLGPPKFMPHLSGLWKHDRLQKLDLIVKVCLLSEVKPCFRIRFCGVFLQIKKSLVADHSGSESSLEINI